MRPRHLMAPLVALLVAALLTFGGRPAARAAALHPVATSAQALPATQITSKVTLPETSIDSPALDSLPTGGANESVIAWTGDDVSHHLNVETSADGLRFGHKLTLNETSSFRPDVAISSVGGPISVAWTGTDANHALNVLYDVYGSSPKKLTLYNESSFTAPALLVSPGFFLAWTGTDANHSLNILSLSVTSSGLVPGQKTVLSQDSSIAAPHMARGSATVIDLAWTSRALQPMLAAATEPAGLQPGAAIPEQSAFAPAIFAIGPFIGAGNLQWLGWTGTDPAHHLNLESTATQFPGPKTILEETALGGPALSFNNGNLIAWTGTDAAHHLNIAKFA
ncbi:MAG TPA: hypothetical protein VHR15_20315 [Ktedonobacterales bacterium]|jgi:hypothetical protein|nr:hypothetical protein [Ktedonobacterales bacterium]